MRLKDVEKYLEKLADRTYRDEENDLSNYFLSQKGHLHASVFYDEDLDEEILYYYVRDYSKDRIKDAGTWLESKTIPIDEVTEETIDNIIRDFRNKFGEHE